MAVADQHFCLAIGLIQILVVKWKVGWLHPEETASTVADALACIQKPVVVPGDEMDPDRSAKLNCQVAKQIQRG